MNRVMLERFHLAEKKGFTYDKTFAIVNAKDVADKVRGEFECINCYEEMFVMFLNNQNNILGIAKIGQGNDVATVANLKLGLKIALDLQAKNLIIIHNHPSDCVRPSMNDKQLTKDCMSACKLLGFELLDSVIIGESGFFSFSDNGLL